MRTDRRGDLKMNSPFKTKKGVILGTGGFAEVVDVYLTHDSPYEIVGFTATGDVEADAEFRGRPFVALDSLSKMFPPDECEIFVAIGYRKLNEIRLNVMEEVKDRGYKLLSYVSSKSSHWVGVPDGTTIGENVFVFEDNTLQPFVSVGDGTILWSGNHIGHHSKIGRGCFISSHVVVSGHCRVGDQTFIGVNATISEGVEIGARNLVGPGTLIQQNSADDAAYLAQRTEAHKAKSSRFMR